MPSYHLRKAVLLFNPVPLLLAAAVMCASLLELAVVRSMLPLDSAQLVQVAAFPSNPVLTSMLVLVLVAAACALPAATVVQADACLCAAVLAMLRAAVCQSARRQLVLVAMLPCAVVHRLAALVV